MKFILKVTNYRYRYVAPKWGHHVVLGRDSRSGLKMRPGCVRRRKLSRNIVLFHSLCLRSRLLVFHRFLFPLKGEEKKDKASEIRHWSSLLQALIFLLRLRTSKNLIALILPFLDSSSFALSTSLSLSRSRDSRLSSLDPVRENFHFSAREPLDGRSRKWKRSLPFDWNDDDDRFNPTANINPFE